MEYKLKNILNKKETQEKYSVKKESMKTILKVIKI